MVVNQLLKYGEFGIVLFDNFQVTERTRNRVASKIARGFESHRLRQVRASWTPFVFNLLFSFSPTFRVLTDIHSAGMAELADASDLGSDSFECRFKSCCPYQTQREPRDGSFCVWCGNGLCGTCASCRKASQWYSFGAACPERSEDVLVLLPVPKKSSSVHCSLIITKISIAGYTDLLSIGLRLYCTKQKRAKYDNAGKDFRNSNQKFISIIHKYWNCQPDETITDKEWWPNINDHVKPI